MSNTALFIVVWLWVVSTGLVLQRWVVPATPWHAGNGLLAGGDWVQFHHQALQLADAIRIQGWSAWEPRFEGQAPASVAAALYALTGVEQPWIVLPLHGVLYGVAVWAVLAIAKALGVHGRWRWLVVLPFLFPSSVLIYGQLHKDILSSPGILLVAYAWAWVFAPKQDNRKIWQPLLAASVGLWLAWWPRPYLAQIALGISAVLWLLAALVSVRERKLGWLTLASVLLFVLFVSYAIAQRVEAQRVEAQRVEAQRVEAQRVCDTWQPEIRLPLIDRPVATLFCYRHGFIQAYPGQGASIDHDRPIVNYREAIEYLPRALQIALFAPFPTHWFTSGTSPGSQVMRPLVGLEMVLIYVAMIGLVWLSWRGSARWIVCALLFFSVAGMVFYVYASPNWGTIYRVRFPFLMILAVVGVRGWLNKTCSLSAC